MALLTFLTQCKLLLEILESTFILASMISVLINKCDKNVLILARIKSQSDSKNKEHRAKIFRLRVNLNCLRTVIP